MPSCRSIALSLCLLHVAVGVCSGFSTTTERRSGTAGQAATFRRYVIPDRRVAYRRTDGCRRTLLPTQVYRAPASPKQSPRYRRRNGSSTTAATEPPADAVVRQLRRLDLSRSSATVLDSYHDLSERQKRQLVQKIRAEHRARQPLDPDQCLEVLYCDEHICVVNKPSGVLSAPGPRRNPSLSNLVYDCMEQTDDILKLDQMIVHRLDMATSGIIVYALTLPALQQLHIDFKDRNVHKTYHAIVEGHLPPTVHEGEIDVALERDPYNPPYMRVAQPRHDNATAAADDGAYRPPVIGPAHKFVTQAAKDSLTTYTVLSREYFHGQPVTRLELRPCTGRTHQLRVHCNAAFGRAIVGDDIYGSTQLDVPLCLHARQLCINHPISGAPMIFEADVPF